MADKYVTALAQFLGMGVYNLPHSPFGSDMQDAVLGERNGYIVCVGLGKSGNGRAAVRTLVRFRPAADTSALRTALEQNSAFLTAIDKKKLPPAGKKTLIVLADAVQWDWEYSFGKPEPPKVAAVVIALADALKGVAAPLEEHCEGCNTRSPGIVLRNRIPGYHCVACQQKQQHEEVAARQQYESQESNFGAGLLFGSVAALIGAIVWGGIAYAAHRIFAYVAILIGLMVGWAVTKGFGKINRAAQVMVGVLTVVSVLFGDAIYVTLTVMQQENVPFSLALLGGVLANFVGIETSDTSSIFSVGFALLGAYYAVKKFRAPEFRATFEPVGNPVVPAERSIAASAGS